MSPSEVEVLGKALAFHPPVIIGALLFFQTIKRRRYYEDKAAMELSNGSINSK